MEGITLKAIFYKATTTIDGAWRISFDVNPDDVAKVAQVSILRDTLLALEITPVMEGGTP